MIFRYAYLVIFLLVVNTASAQQSMMQNVDNAYLNKLIATAKANYPRVKVNDINVHMAQLGIKKAKLDWFSLISFTYLYSPNNTFSYVNPSLLNGYQIGFSTSIGGIIQRPTEIKIAKESYRLAELNRDEYNLAITGMIKKLYYVYVQQMTVLEWRTKSLENAEASMKEIKYKFEKGVETFDNYNKAQTFLYTTTQSKIDAEGSLLISKSSLEEILGTSLESVK